MRDLIDATFNLSKHISKTYSFFFCKNQECVAPGGIINEDLIDQISSFSNKSHKTHSFCKNQVFVGPGGIINEGFDQCIISISPNKSQQDDIVFSKIKIRCPRRDNK